MPVLSVRNLRKVYGSRSGGTVEALAGIDFDVNSGEFLGIMGPSGSGKSTLLHLLATIEQADTGQIQIDGVDTRRLSGSALADFRRQRLGFVFQEFNLMDTLSLAENIILPLIIDHSNPQDVQERLHTLAQNLAIEEVLNKYPYEVSGGQKQRAAVARALIHHPDLILADEPTGALDSRASVDLLERLEDLNQRLGTTIVMVSHDPFAASFCRRILFIKDGALFSELYRGQTTRQDFFQKILHVQGVLGGTQHELAQDRP